MALLRLHQLVPNDWRSEQASELTFKPTIMHSCATRAIDCPDAEQNTRDNQTQAGIPRIGCIDERFKQN